MGITEAVLLFIVTVILLVFSFLVIRVSSAYAERGWVAYYNVMTKMQETSSLRISTLENKLMSHSWQEFANLQEVPDESAKVTQLDIARNHSELDRAEWIRSQQALDGDDLEGEIFEGPTLG